MILCHYMFTVHCSLWWNIKGGCKSKVCITGNFSTQVFFLGVLSEGGAEWGFDWTCRSQVSFAPFVKSSFWGFCLCFQSLIGLKIFQKLLNYTHSLQKFVWLPYFIDGRNWVWDSGMTLVQFFKFLGFQRGFWSGKWCQITGAFCKETHCLDISDTIQWHSFTSQRNGGLILPQLIFWTDC